MERKSPYLKIAAVVSAVLLVGAFVSYRAGAFQRPAPPEPQPEPAAPTDTEPRPTPSADQPQHFLYSSKSAPAFTPASPPPTVNPPAPGNPPAYMGSSKWISIVPTGPILADPPKPAPNAAPNAAKP